MPKRRTWTRIHPPQVALDPDAETTEGTMLGLCFWYSDRVPVEHIVPLCAGFGTESPRIRGWKLVRQGKPDIYCLGEAKGLEYAKRAARERTR